MENYSKKSNTGELKKCMRHQGSQTGNTQERIQCFYVNQRGQLMQTSLRMTLGAILVLFPVLTSTVIFGQT